MAKRKKPSKKLEPTVGPSSIPGGYGVNVSLQGVAEALDTKVVQSVYRDGLRKPLKAASDLVTQIIATTNYALFKLPFVLASMAKERLFRDLEECTNKVPEERRVESPPEIAGPVIQQLQFMQDDNPLRQLFLNLLTASIDRDKQAKVHPAFTTLLPQLSADEAKLLAAIHALDSAERCQEFVIGWKSFFQIEGLAIQDQYITRLNPFVPLSSVENVHMYLDRLQAFTLIKREQESDIPRNREFADSVQFFNAYTQLLNLTKFGILFSEAVGLSSAQP